MSTDTWNRVQELFFMAVDLHGDARSVFLDQECGCDTCLRSEVESLLDADGSADFNLASAIKAEALALLGEYACRSHA